jgi:hypothetical protein
MSKMLITGTHTFYQYYRYSLPELNEKNMSTLHHTVTGTVRYGTGTSLLGSGSGSAYKESESLGMHQ